MTVYVVSLQIIESGATVGSTRDAVEAEMAEEAERLAIEAWTAACPGRVYLPLVTTQQ